jgi:hypothetical protein
MGPWLTEPAAAVASATSSAEPRHREAGSRWASVAVLGGASAWDPRLDDYQWNVGPHAAYGAQALAGAGALAGGVRLWRSQSSQSIDPNSSVTEATVHATSLELVGRARLASRWGTAMSADLTGGWLRLSYAPDHAQVATGGGTVDVEFRPIDTWVAGAGVAFERTLAGSWSLGLGVNQRLFSLEAAHRNGSSIEVGREQFLDWSARLEVAKHWGWR